MTRARRSRLHHPCRTPWAGGAARAAACCGTRLTPRTPSRPADQLRRRELEARTGDPGGLTVPRTDHWAPYAPDDKTPWDLLRVVHLHRRAGFAAGWAELQRDLK